MYKASQLSTQMDGGDGDVLAFDFGGGNDKAAEKKRLMEEKMKKRQEELKRKAEEKKKAKEEGGPAEEDSKKAKKPAIASKAAKAKDVDVEDGADKGENEGIATGRENKGAQENEMAGGASEVELSQARRSNLVATTRGLLVVARKLRSQSTPMMSDLSAKARS